MKSMMKMVGIIAVLALIGLVSGCQTEVDPDDQTVITVTNIPDNFNGLFATVGVRYTDKKGEQLAISVPRLISGGQVTNCSMIDSDMNLLIVDEGQVVIIITKDEELTDKVYQGVTAGNVKLGKSAQTVNAADAFSPSIVAAGTKYTEDTKKEEALGGAPSEKAFGIYICNNNLPTSPEEIQIESIYFSKTTFEIFDSTLDTFTFTIDKWEEADVYTASITGMENYKRGYKFTGKITAAKNAGVKIESTDTDLSGNSTNGYFNSSNTAPGINPSDMNKNEVSMYLYVKEDTDGNISEFVRSSFSKDGSLVKPIPINETGTSTPVTNVSKLRVYKKL